MFWRLDIIFYSYAFVYYLDQRTTDGFDDRLLFRRQMQLDSAGKG